MKEYESHSMSISMSIAHDYIVEDYPTESPINAGQGASWVAKNEAGKVEHIEKISSATGTQILEHREIIDFTCGSGTNGCSYFRFDGGRMYQSPITWYSEDRKWDLSPGYNVEDHFRFERMAGDGCLVCHAGRMNPTRNQRGVYNVDKPFHELAIGCERCHGPGKEHIQFHESSANKTSADPIVNPEKLSPELREAVCYQCHLSGEPRVTRYGRTDFDFRPGMHLSDVWVTFLKSGKDTGGEVKAVSQVEQMRHSKCFTKSEGEFGCISCHDPHGSPETATKIDFYRDRCLTCHEPDSNQTECSKKLDERKKLSPNDSCIQCHMPKLKSDDIAHHALTDHRVHIPGQEFRVESDVRDEKYRVWKDKEIQDHVVVRAKTIAKAAAAFTGRKKELAGNALNELKNIEPANDDLSLREAIAQLYLVSGNAKEAFQIWSELLDQFPLDQFLLDQVATALHNADELEEAYPVYERLFAVNNRRPSVLIRHLEVCKKLSKYEDGIKVAQRILELEPGIQSVHQWLARAYRRTGNNQKSEYHRKLAEQLPGARR